MVQIWERCKPLQLINPVNTDHAMFIWKSKPVSSFSKKLSRYQNRKILLSLNVIAFILNYWLLRLLGCLMYNIESPITFAILEK